MPTMLMESYLNSMFEQLEVDCYVATLIVMWNLECMTIPYVNAKVQRLVLPNLHFTIFE